MTKFQFEWQIATCMCVDYRITLYRDGKYYLCEARLVGGGTQITIYREEYGHPIEQQLQVPIDANMIGLGECDAALEAIGYAPVNVTDAYRRMMNAATRAEFYERFRDHKMAPPTIRCRHGH